MKRQRGRRDRERLADLTGGETRRSLLHEPAKERQAGFLGKGGEAVQSCHGFHVSKTIEVLGLCQGGAARYYSALLLRFLALAALLLLLVLALGTMALAAFHLAPDLGPLAARGVARPEGLPGSIRLASWAFEALALVALFLLVWGRTPRWWLDGLAVGAAAWTFRGPLLVLAVAGMTRLPVSPFWQLARGALVLDLVAALGLALLARSTLGDPRRDAIPDETAGEPAGGPTNRPGDGR